MKSLLFIFLTIFTFSLNSHVFAHGSKKAECSCCKEHAAKSTKKSEDHDYQTQQPQ